MFEIGDKAYATIHNEKHYCTIVDNSDKAIMIVQLTKDGSRYYIGINDLELVKRGK